MMAGEQGGDGIAVRLNSSVLVQLGARLLTYVVSLVAIPYIVWTVSNIYESARRISIVEAQVGELRSQVGELRAQVGGAYRLIDATRDQAAIKERLDGQDRRQDRLEGRLDAIQSDLAAIQRASAAPLPGEQRKRQ
jgi:hypothetical protein